MVAKGKIFLILRPFFVFTLEFTTTHIAKLVKNAAHFLLAEITSFSWAISATADA